MAQLIQRIVHLQTETVPLQVPLVLRTPWYGPVWMFFARESIEGSPRSVKRSQLKPTRSCSAFGAPFIQQKFQNDV